MTFAPKGGYQKPKEKYLITNRGHTKAPLDIKKVSLPQMSRPVGKTSLYFFKLYQRCWRWSMALLPFYAFMLLFLPLVQEPVFTQELTEIIEQVCIALILVSFSWFIKNWTLTRLTGWNSTRGKLFNFLERNPILIVVILALMVALEVYLKVGQFSVAFVVLTLIIVIGGFKSVRQSWKERLQKEKTVSNDLTAQVEAFNQKLFLIHLIPLLAAGLTVFISSVAFALSTHLSPNFLISISVGVIMLSLMQAEEVYFMIICPRCGTKTSRFLEQYEACLACLHNERNMTAKK